MKHKNNIKYNKCLIETYQNYRDFLLMVKDNEDFKISNLEEKIFLYYSMFLLESCIKSGLSDFAAGSISDIIKGLLYNDIIGKTLHIFIPDQKLYKLLESIPVKDITGMKNYIKENGEDTIFKKLKISKDFKDAEFEDLPEQKCLYYCIHFPVEINKNGLSVRLRINKDELICDYIIGNEVASFSSESKYLKNPETVTDKTDIKMWQLMVNTFFYIKTFPECVKKGVPSGFTFEFPTKSEKIKIGISEKILEKTEIKNNNSIIITPHFRKGHFRYLFMYKKQ